jgi:hypothetical protein
MPVNQYVEFVREWSKNNNLTYMCAIGNPKLKADYLKFKSGESYGVEMDFQPKPKKKKVEQEFEITPAPKKKKVEQEFEIEINPRKKVAKPKPVPVPVPVPKPPPPAPTPKQKATPVPKVKVKKRPIREHEESQIASKSAWLTESFDRYLNKLKTENYPVNEFNSRKQENIDFLKELIDELTNQRKEYIDGGGYNVSIAMNKYRDFLEKFKSLKFDKNSLINYLKEMAKIENLSDKQLTQTFDRLQNLKYKNEDESIQNLIQKALENIQQMYDDRNKRIQLSDQEEKCLELFKKLNIVTRSDFNKQVVKYKKEAREKGWQEFEKYPPYVELVQCRGVLEDQLLKNPQQAKPSAPETPVMSPVEKQLLLKYLSREELYKLIEAKATPK